MKIKAVRAYQSVPFEGKEQRHLAAVTLSQGSRGRELKLEEVKGVGIKITSTKDAIIVPFANCACIILDQSKMETSFKATANSKI